MSVKSLKKWCVNGVSREEWKSVNQISLCSQIHILSTSVTLSERDVDGCFSDEFLHCCLMIM